MSTDTALLPSIACYLTNLVQQRPNDVGLIIADKQGEHPYSYQYIYDRALDIACTIQQSVKQDEVVTGQRALLLMDTSIDYVCAFFACMYSGVVAVPVLAPDDAREQSIQRLRGVAEDSESRWILTTARDADVLQGGVHNISQAEIIEVDRLPQYSGEYPSFNVAADELAFLQYTSGSTSAPKGVMVSHGNLVANERAISNRLLLQDDDVFVSWLPLYHDMGLICGLLQPFFCGNPLVLMSPRFFLERPSRWLDLLSRYKGTISGGPDFSYRLCVDRVRASQLESMDLSRWRVAFSGAEPVRAATLNDFTEHLQVSGLPRTALTPCYGLAEATLFVTSPLASDAYQTTDLSVQALANGRVVRTTATDSNAVATQVSCGTIADDHQVLIVDPTSQQLCAADQVGEVWVSGPSIAQGYWKNPVATDAVFPEKEGVRWLRTGDLGFLLDDQLYISGRNKDLIIINGTNLYPQDVEAAIEDRLDWVRKGRVTAFAATKDGQEGIGLALEIPRSTQRNVSPLSLFADLNQVVGDLCQQSAAVVLLLQPGALPKTTSGKLQRSACQQGWQDASLDCYAEISAGRLLHCIHEQWLAAAQALPEGELEQTLASLWCQLLSVEQVYQQDHFLALGGNSVQALQLQARIRQQWLIELSLKQLLDNAILQQMAGAIELQQQSGERYLPVEPAGPGIEPQLSDAQYRLWLADQIAKDAKDKTAYNMAGALRFKGVLDTAVLTAALSQILQRHEILRSCYPANEDAEPVVKLVDVTGVDCPFTDLSAQAQPDVLATQLLAEEAEHLFDLSTGPLLRFALLKLADDEHQLLINMHHIISDGWSVSVLMDELVTLCKAGADAMPAVLPALAVQYTDFAHWQRLYLQGTTQQRLNQFWQHYLQQAPATSQLPTKAERPAIFDSSGAAVHFRIPGSLCQAVDNLAVQCNSTTYTVLLASYQLLMHGCCQQQDFVVGTDVAGRSRLEFESLIGFFVNVLPVRSHLHAELGFDQWVQAKRADVLEVFDHAELPLDRIIDAAQPSRVDGSAPLLQQLFVLHNTPETGAMPDGLSIDLINAPVTSSKFDSALFLTPDAQGLACEWAYATRLYDADTFNRLSSLWLQLLTKLVATPTAALHEFIDFINREFAMNQLAQPDVASGRKKTKLSKLKKKRTAAVTPQLSIRTAFVDQERRFPLIIEATTPDLDPVSWAASERVYLEKMLMSHGALLLRNFAVDSPQVFEAIAEAVHPGLYGAYGDLPKKEGGKNTYRSTPYPEKQMILYHNESAHQERWPRKQFFFCELPSPIGGATPIVDCRRMLQHLPEAVVAELEQKGLKYIRTFGQQLDVSWQHFFKTEDRTEVEQHCRDAGIEFEWLDEESLQIRTLCPAVVEHPLTGERSFFNQVQLHHIACLEPQVKEDLLSMVGLQRMPRHVTYGDGSPISDETMALIGEAYEACALRFDWQQGDVVMVDNMLVAHARDPFEGARRIVVAMGDLVTREQLDNGSYQAPEAAQNAAQQLKTEGAA